MSDVATKRNIAERLVVGLRRGLVRGNRRTLTALSFVVVALALVVAACSGVDDSGTSKNTLATQAARQAQVPSPVAASPGASPGASPVLPAGDSAAGQALYAAQGCQGCHSVNGSKLVGPSWKGLYGSQVELEGGQTVTADDAYIHESIVQPQAKIVKGYTTVQMPPFSQLTNQQISDIIAYIKTLQ